MERKKNSYRSWLWAYGRNGFLDGLRDVRKEGHSSFEDSEAFFRRCRGMDVVRSASVAQLEEAHAQRPPVHSVIVESVAINGTSVHFRGFTHKRKNKFQSSACSLNNLESLLHQLDYKTRCQGNEKNFYVRIILLTHIRFSTGHGNGHLARLQHYNMYKMHIRLV